MPAGYTMKDIIEMQRKRLLESVANASGIIALDVEGTILHYDYSTFSEETGEAAPILLEDLPIHLSALRDQGYLIVLASATEAQRINAQIKHFTEIGIEHLIHAYRPDFAEESQSKHVSLRQYQDMLASLYSKVFTKEQIHFYDDAPGNVKAAKDEGFVNSYTVNPENPYDLSQQLESLRFEKLKHALSVPASPAEGILKEHFNQFYSTLGQLSIFKPKSAVLPELDPESKQVNLKAEEFCRFKA